MISASLRDLLTYSAKLFTSRSHLLSLWQEIGDNFYPERADFTFKRSLGTEFASHLMDSYPLLVRRDLGNSITSMLRPAGKDWGEMSVAFRDVLDNESERWLEWAWDRERRAMYDRASHFTRATKEGDHDFAAFGQCVIHVGLNRDKTNLLYRTHHLRDVAWSENEEGNIDHVFVKYVLPARDLVHYFKGRVSEQVNAMLGAGRDAYAAVNCQHMIVPADRYPDVASRHPYRSLWIDTDNQFVMEAVPSRRREYVIPRWQTVSGSQYAFSPATITALPDARLIQAMALVLLEAGEKFVNPPLIATQETVRSEVAVYAGGITWVDADYDERLGESLRPLSQDKSGIPIGFEMSDRQKKQIHEAFYLNKISMLPMEKEATAFEVSQMVQEYIRQATPLFEPMEIDYNGGLCEETFEVLMWAGAFGSPDSIPRALRGQDIEFKFKSPLHEAEGREKGGKLLELIQLIQPASTLDPAVTVHVDIHAAFRDAIEGMNIPSKWIVGEEEAAAAIEAKQMEAQLTELVQSAGAVAETAETAGRAGQELESADQMQKAR